MSSESEDTDPENLGINPKFGAYKFTLFLFSEHPYKPSRILPSEVTYHRHSLHTKEVLRSWENVWFFFIKKITYYQRNAFIYKEFIINGSLKVSKTCVLFEGLWVPYTCYSLTRQLEMLPNSRLFKTCSVSNRHQRKSYYSSPNAETKSIREVEKVRRNICLICYRVPPFGHGYTPKESRLELLALAIIMLGFLGTFIDWALLEKKYGYRVPKIIQLLFRVRFFTMRFINTYSSWVWSISLTVND